MLHFITNLDSKTVFLSACVGFIIAAWALIIIERIKARFWMKKNWLSSGNFIKNGRFYVTDPAQPEKEKHAVHH